MVTATTTANEGAATTANLPLTYEYLLTTPEGDGNRYEVLAGELFATASPSKRHAWICTRLSRWMGTFVEENGLGEVFGTPVDVKLTHHDIVVPDVFFLRQDRLHLFDDKKVEGAPDLIVEVLSPSTRSRDLTAKMRLYAEVGVQEYWIVDQVSPEITVYARSPNGSFELVPTDPAHVHSRVIPGFELNSGKLIAGFD